MDELDSMDAVRFKHRARKAHLVLDPDGFELFYFTQRTTTWKDWFRDLLKPIPQKVGNLYDHLDHLVVVVEPGKNDEFDWLEIFDEKRSHIATVEHHRRHREHVFDYKNPKGNLVYKIRDTAYNPYYKIYAPDDETEIGGMDPITMLDPISLISRPTQFKFPAGIDLKTKVGLIVTVVYIYQTLKGKK
ncbi:GL12643 [Drosophila persimilis]|uniref:GL12643 n=1 Tax=Drosophila persimilis TaxID=7234 RepID=B4GLU4_DROPE|nr:GL12643 [Drosophila persimilis]